MEAPPPFAFRYQENEKTSAMQRVVEPTESIYCSLFLHFLNLKNREEKIIETSFDGFKELDL
jgi:hypothetical protein